MFRLKYEYKVMSLRQNVNLLSGISQKDGTLGKVYLNIWFYVVL